MNKFQFIQHKINFLPASCHFYQVLSLFLLRIMKDPSTHMQTHITCPKYALFFRLFFFSCFHSFSLIGHCLCRSCDYGCVCNKTLPYALYLASLYIRCDAAKNLTLFFLSPKVRIPKKPSI